MPAHSEQSKVKVCCFCERWESGGIESFLYNVLMRFDLTHIQVDIVTASFEKSVFTEPLRQRGIRFFVLSGSQRNVLENYRQFRVLLKERHYDVLHLNIFHGLSLAYLSIAKQEGISSRIAHSHNTALRKSISRPIKLVVHNREKERYTKDATDLWACSRNAADFLFSARELKRHGFQFIPNGIDTERFRFNPAIGEAVRKDLGLTGQFVIGNVGRLCYQKNQSFLLDVFAEVLKRRPNSRLLLVGEGEDKPFLLEKAKKYGLLNKILFYGTTGQVEQLLWAMDVFAFPSRFEGLGIAAIEAQTAGLPVVCSECIPKETYVTNHMRTVSLSQGSSAWAETLATASGRFSCGADSVRRAGFDITDVAKRLEDCYMRSEIHGEPQNLSHYPNL